MIASILKQLKNHPRLRIFIIFTLLVVISILALKACSNTSKTYLQSSVVGSDLNTDYQSSQQNDNYQRLVKQEIEKKRQQAINQNGSYIEDIYNTNHQRLTQNTNQKATANIAMRQLNQSERLTSPREFYKQQLNENNQLSSNNQKSVPIQDLQKNMGLLLKSWSKAPTMQKIQVESLNDLAAGSGDAMKPVMIKAGTVLIGVIDTALDSDQSGTPVLAHIVVGKYKGAKLLGSFARQDDKLVIQFNTLAMKTMSRSISIRAYAVDQSTAQSGLATSVNHHYLLRYGSLFAASFLQGFGTYFSNTQNRCIGIEIGGKPICFNDNRQSYNATDAMRSAAFSGLGQIGTALSSSVAKQFNRPPTVKLSQGSAIGVLFMQDV